MNFWVPQKYLDAIDEFYDQKAEESGSADKNKLINDEEKVICPKCRSTESFWQAMALRCERCNEIILGGTMEK